jgi:hypothetical protein
MQVFLILVARRAAAARAKPQGYSVEGVLPRASSQRALAALRGAIAYDLKERDMKKLRRKKTENVATVQY